VQYTIRDFGRRAGRYGQAVHRSQSQDLAWDRARQTIAFEVVQVLLALACRASHIARLEQGDARRSAYPRTTPKPAAKEAGSNGTRCCGRVELSLARQALLGAVASDARRPKRPLNV